MRRSWIYSRPAPMWCRSTSLGYGSGYPDKARAVRARCALRRALQEHGARCGTTALHICFGYAALVAGRPAAYSFLAELENSPVHQISIETAQAGLDCAVLAKLPSKTIILGVLDLSTAEVETLETVADRIRRRAALRQPGPAGNRAGLRIEISASRGGVREDEGDGGRRWLVRAELTVTRRSSPTPRFLA